MKKLLLTAIMLSVMAFSVSASYEVWQDTTGNGVPDTFKGLVESYYHGTDVVTAYDYYSHSSHMSNPIPQSKKSKLWLYENDGPVFLGMFHHKDKANPNKWTDVKWGIWVKGTPSKLVFSDEPGELIMDSPGKFKGDWSFKKNTDGGIIAFKGGHCDWQIKISPKKWGIIDKWRFGNSGGSNIVLNQKYDTFVKPHCPDEEIPEFSTIGAGLALLGAGLVVAKRRKK